MDLPDIVRLEERRQAAGLKDIALEWRPCAGGVAGRAKPGNWTNYVTGAALDGPPAPGEIEDITRWFEEVGVEARFEVAPTADPALIKELERLGFALRLFENVFARELKQGDSFAPTHPPSPELSIERIDPADEARCREYGRVIMLGFRPGFEPEEHNYDLALRGIRHPRVRTFAAVIDGRIVGGGAMELTAEVAGLYGMSVLPEFRRHGIQQAMLAHRLRHALEHGAKLATIGSKPGIPTERNVKRLGFELAYAKVHVAKAGEGLTPLPE